MKQRKTGKVGRSEAASAEAGISGHAAEKKSFPIVGIGASAGGLEAFTELLKALPVDTGMGFVLVQHLDPDRASELTHILARTTAMRVQEAARNNCGVS
jgi:two-component system CheB/CheR fusion protein